MPRCPGWSLVPALVGRGPQPVRELVEHAVEQLLVGDAEGAGGEDTSVVDVATLHVVDGVEGPEARAEAGELGEQREVGALVHQSHGLASVSAVTVGDEQDQVRVGDEAAELGATLAIALAEAEETPGATVVEVLPVAAEGVLVRHVQGRGVAGATLEAQALAVDGGVAAVELHALVVVLLGDDAAVVGVAAEGDDLDLTVGVEVQRDGQHPLDDLLHPTGAEVAPHAGADVDDEGDLGLAVEHAEACCGGLGLEDHALEVLILGLLCCEFHWFVPCTWGVWRVGNP